MTADNVFPEGIDTHNIPHIPQHVWDRFEPYKKACKQSHAFAFEHPANARDSPYGIYYLTVPEGQSTSEVHFTRAPDAEGVQITQLTKRGMGRTIVQWVPIASDHDEHGHMRNGGALFRMDDNGEEMFGIYRFLPGKEGQEYQIERWTPPKVRNGPILVSNGGNKYAYASNVERAANTNVYIRDLKAVAAGSNGVGDVGLALTNEKGMFFPVSFSLDDKYLLVHQRISATNTKMFLVATDGSTALEEIVLPLTHAMDENGMPKIANTITRAKVSLINPDLVYMIVDWMSDFMNLIAYHLKTKEIFPITTPSLDTSILPISWNIMHFAVSKRYLIFVANEDGLDILYSMELATNKISKVKSPTGVIPAIITSLGFPKDVEERGLLDVAYVEVNSTISPGTLYLLNLDNVEWQIYVASAKDRPHYHVSEPRLIHWKSFDGLPISAFCYFPPPYKVPEDLSTFQCDRKLPIVVYIHGGPESQFRPSFNANLYLQFLCNELGCVIIGPNVRGSNGYGQKFLSLDDQEKREDSVKDIGALLEFIKKSMPYVDESKISVMGRSYGGYMVFACMIHFGDQLRCGVETCGVTHFVNFMETTSEHRRDMRRAEYGDERIPAMREKMHQISPLTRAHEIHKPLFMCQGKNDTRVPYTEFLKMKAKLVDAMGDENVWWMAADNEGHVFRQQWVTECLALATYMFLSHFLLERDP